MEDKEPERAAQAGADEAPAPQATTPPIGTRGPGLSKAEPSEKPAPAGYQVTLPMFEGPLDLLLHLIQKHELDILNIPIAFVSEKYFEYIKSMEELSIDVASEYLVMAATLVHIKSRSLLPPSPEDQTTEEQLDEDDPRAELILRLLAYQKYKLAAEQLGGRSVLGRDVFERGAPLEQATSPAELVPPSLFQLMDAFRGLLARAEQLADHQIDFERISITDRIGQLSDLLRDRGEARFEDLFVGQFTKADLIVTFLAILEMTRLRLTRVRQDGPLEPIVVELAVRDETALADALNELSGQEDFERQASLASGEDEQALPLTAYPELEGESDGTDGAVNYEPDGSERVVADEPDDTGRVVDEDKDKGSSVD